MRHFLWAALLALASPARAADLAFGKQSGILFPMTAEVDSAPDWAVLWARHDAGRGLPRPDVDFSKDRVVATFSGGPDRSFALRAEPKTRPLKVMRRVTNDYLIAPAGLLGLLGRGVSGLDGDDLGYTHGAELEVSGAGPRGFNYTFHAGSDLYTKPTGEKRGRGPDGHFIVPIFFTQRSVLSGAADNFEGRDGLKWKLGAGVRVLDSERAAGVGAKGQQVAFHKLSKAKGHQVEYIYRPDGLGVRAAVFMQAALGYGRTLAERGAFALKSLAFAEPTVFATGGGSSLKLHAELSASLEKLRSKTSVVAGAGLIAHDEGVQSDLSFGVSYGRRRWGLESKVHFPGGELANEVGYNWDNAPYSSLALYTVIGGAKRPVKKRPRPRRRMRGGTSP